MAEALNHDFDENINKQSDKKTIEDVIKEAGRYLKDQKNIDIIRHAYNVAVKMHEGQFRRSGDPYVQHPIEVAYILATMNTGPATIAAGLLHDVLEDTNMSKEEMEAEFGKEIVQIVDGVTKISKLKYMTKEKALAHNHEKLLLAMAKDIRVILIKLADRLHNMRTIEFHSSIEKQKTIAQETLDLYAPLANRLGIYRLKAELEDISFKVLNKDEYYEIAKIAGEKKAQREEDIQTMMSKIKDMLEQHHIENFKISGRIKNIYSIYKKTVSKNKKLNDIFDLLALRIIVDSVESCYRVLGIIHGSWTPLPMRFKDYIAVPKQNLYQSLHTTIVGLEGKIFEVQIRTYEMDKIAEYGVAAHWAYKESSNFSQEVEQIEITNKLKWYKDLSTYVENAESEDPINSIIDDIFSANVYVFTPRGDVFDFPTGATPLDFAYRIHSGVGNKTVGAIVNGKMVPLTYKLQTSDVVEIKTNNASTGPTDAWLKIAHTQHAKTKIKNYLNKKQRDEIVAKGMQEFELVAKNANYNIADLTDEKAAEMFKQRNVKTLEDFYWEIGKGSLSALGSINRLTGVSTQKITEESLLEQYSEDTASTRQRRSHNGYGIIVDGLERAQIKIGNCCQAVHGDEIIGYVSRGNGIIVHRKGCPNIKEDEQERYINLSWDPTFTGKVFDATLKVSSIDRRNGVADMINALNSTKVTISSVKSVKNKVGECITQFKIQVANLESLHLAIIALHNLPDIYEVERVFK